MELDETVYYLQGEWREGEKYGLNEYQIYKITTSIGA